MDNLAEGLPTEDQIARTARKQEEYLDQQAKAVQQALRIEALRAASRIVAGKYEAFKVAGYGPGSLTIQLAEQFATYLETGE